MKKLSITAILVAMSFFNNYGQEKLPINVKHSQINWIGEYTFYFGGHNGTIDFKEGYFIKENELITGGKFIIDMNSIKNIDIDDEEGKEGLVNHLKDPDFFDVANFPVAKLVMERVEYIDATHMKILADLTIKGITKPIEFRAEVNYEKKQLLTKFKIDRMKWGVNYNSKLRDGAISDAIGFDVILSL